MSSRYGNWVVQKSVGEGGQSHAFLVQHASTQELAVLKRLKNTKRLDRFATEIEALRRCNHPQIIKLVDAALDSESPYFVVEYCERGSLADYPAMFQGDATAALTAFRGLCSAIGAAHAEGVVHRDIKPSNILVRENGTLVVADFGICYIEDGQRQTLTEEAVGPRLFIAPELEDGRLDSIDVKSDIYSLGKLLYWMVRGDGRVFAREVFRDESWNLVRFLHDDRLEHLNRLLDQMVVVDRTKRHPQVSMAAEDAGRVGQLLLRGVNVIAPHIRQQCIYCATGTYLEWSGGAYNFGLNNVGSPEWMILRCNNCGNVQIFRFDKLDRPKELWGLRKA